MATTTNNSGISGENADDLGPDEKWDDETDEQYRVRMEKKRIAKEKHEEWLRTRMPPCIG
jgi:hypothetical protein